MRLFACDELLERTRHRVGITDIGRRGNCLLAACCDRRGGLACRVGVLVEDAYHAAFCRKRAGDGLTDSCGSPGDDRDATF